MQRNFDKTDDVQVSVGEGRTKSRSRSLWWFGLVALVAFFVLFFLLKCLCKPKRSPKHLPSAPLEGRRFLVIRNYNNQAGFFFCIYTLLAASHEARKRGLELVSWFDSGLYLERDAAFREQFKEYVRPKVAGTENWFHYFFEPLGESDPAVAAFIAKSLMHMKSLSEWDKFKDDARVRVFEFEYHAFQKRDAANTDNHREWNESARVLPHVETEAQRYWAPYPESEGWFRIGIHVRGTDKMDGPEGYGEDGPKHLEYERYYQMVQREIDALPVSQRRDRVVVLACSDEQPFIDFMQRERASRSAPWSLLITNSIRAQVNTSGWDLQSHLCTPLNFSENCRKYRALAAQSIHRGMPDKSNYLKGLQVLVEVLLLSRCRIFLRSRGNVSNFPGYINPSMRVLDMVEESEK